MSDHAITTYIGVAHPWMCDIMGHVNVRHYAAMFDDASFQLLGHIVGPVADKTKGWADVRSVTEYAQEVEAGELITIRSRVLTLGRSSVTFEQTMAGTLDDVVRAVNQTVSVRFDLIARKAIALDDDMRARAQSLVLQSDQA